ncbi:MAG: phosphoribosyltransferase [Candidatus Nanohaloarchaea archaeon]|nr:phosphoribosyltransferase [Candidatus Nanohaloarchaea archaeon]
MGDARPEELVDLDDWEEFSRRLFASAKLLVEEAYEEGGYHEEAVDALETFGRPVVQHLHGDRDEPVLDEEGLEDWVARYADDIERIDEEIGGADELDGLYRDYKVPPGDERLDTFYDSLQDQVEPDRFDYVVGIYSSGIPPMYVAADHLDADELIVKYSTLRDDDAVDVSPRMEERAELDDAEVLLVDDAVLTGETLTMTGEYFRSQGAEVYAVPLEQEWQKTVDNTVLRMGEGDNVECWEPLDG